MERLTDAAAMRAWARREAAAGRRIVLVPTMGFLHDGHLALVRAARAHGERVVVSIFVNPTQFGPAEDLAAYPRDLERDLALLAPLGVDAVFTPAPADLYPPGFDTFVVPGKLAAPLCGARRPGHFRGVATVVLILFRLTGCAAAVFGEKDYQQLAVIRRMTADLQLGVEIVAHPTVREPDGLAMSSRNSYLSADERRLATLVPRLLERIAGELASGTRRVPDLLSAGHAALPDRPELRLDYLEIVDAETLEPLTTVDRPAVAAVALVVGTTRLIDNRRLIP